AVDVLLGRERDGFLRLRHFEVVCNAGGEAVSCLGKLLRRQVARLGRDLELLAAGLQIEKRAADFVVDAGFRVFRLRTQIAELRVGCEQTSVDPAALEDRYVQRTDD